jgi:hypothetical protein
MNYCKPSENLNFNQIESWTYQVTGSIVSTQNISNGLTVKYQAGSFIELNNGFVSGTDFIAEINPCVISRTTIAAKTDDTVEFDVTEEFNGQLLASNDVELQIYPTALASGQGCKIVATKSLNNLQVVVFDLNGRPVSTTRIETLHQKTPHEMPLPALSKGIYLVKAQNAVFSFTQKIIIQ